MKHIAITASALILVAVGVILQRHESPEPTAQTASPTTAENECPGPPSESSLRMAAVETEPPAPPGEPQLGFEDYVQRIVTLGIEMTHAARAADSSTARSIDSEARALLIELGNRFADSGQRAVDALTVLADRFGTGAKAIAGEGSEASTSRELGEPGVPIELDVRRKVLLKILEDRLQAAFEAQRHGAPRAPVEQLVALMLVSLPQDARLAREFSKQLAGKPYLGPTHEPELLNLAVLSSELSFLRPLVAALLQTLWVNLEASGDYDSTQLANLALLFRDDPNSAKRQAALEHLLTADGGRFRELAVEQACASGDLSLASALAQAAVHRLEPEVALEILTRLSRIEGARLSDALMVLGVERSDLLIQRYEQQLADGVAPSFRADLITGMGFDGGEDAVKLARIAIEQDPVPEVRRRALFVLTARSEPEVSEQILTALLDDPALGEDPIWVGLVALSLGNVASQPNSANVVARLGERLRIHPALIESSKRELESLLTKHLPHYGR